MELTRLDSLHFLRLRGQTPAAHVDTEMPFYEFHVFAAAYGWSHDDYGACPSKILPYLARYIGADKAMADKRMADMLRQRG